MRYNALIVDDFTIDNFHRTRSYVVEPLHPIQVDFQLLAALHSLRLFHPVYKRLKAFLRLLVNIGKDRVSLSACQQVIITDFTVLF